MAARKKKPDITATVTFPDETVVPFGGRADPRQAEAFSQEETGEVIAAGKLRSFVERIERLDEERKSLGDDRRDVLLEAKSRGFSTKAITTIVRLRAMDPEERQVQEAILELYKSALGMA